jgi:hypothetical protein
LGEYRATARSDKINTHEMVPVAESDDCIRIVFIVERKMGIVRVFHNDNPSESVSLFNLEAVMQHVPSKTINILGREVTSDTRQ